MDVHEAIRIRRSVRAYQAKEIPAEILAKLRDALRLAPSACNNQPWHFVFIMNRDLRRKVATACRNQHWVSEAPVVVAACGYPARAYQKMGGYGNSLDIDLAIALDHLTLAAAAEGLGTCWIGAFDEAEVKKLLRVPESVKVVALTPLGYPAAADAFRPAEPNRRKPEAEVFSTDYFPAG